MFLKNIFTNFWSNIIVLIIFVVFMIKVFLEQNTFKKSIKIKFNDFFVMLCMGVAFVAGVAVISFAILPLEKMVNSVLIILLKILLYLILAYTLNKLWKFIRVQEDK